MICVFDSSVWVSAFHFGGTPLLALKAAHHDHSIAISRAIRDEVSTTLIGKFRWSSAQIQAAFDEFRLHTVEASTTGHLRGVCRDPKDDMVLECAVVAKAEAIVTGDKDLLSLCNYRGIRIMTAREFLALADKAATN